MRNPRAYMHDEDGKRWLRIITDDRGDWDEPIANWTLVLDMTKGQANWRHMSGLEIPDAPNFC